MPELPEVHTTVTGLQKVLIGKTITKIWTDYPYTNFWKDKENIKDPKYFKKFKKTFTGSKVLDVSRLAKNIVIHTNTGHIIIHMKMTGHLMYGDYNFDKKDKTYKATDPASPLADPFNKWIHFCLELSDSKKLVFSDMRKFGRIFYTTEKHTSHDDLSVLGPDAYFEIENYKELRDSILSKNSTLPIKTALMDQHRLAGIGNIYSDEMLWYAGINPKRKPQKIKDDEWRQMFKAMKKILKQSIKEGGDSLSDYRNAFGEKGNFQNFHKAYGRKNEPCPKVGCGGTIKRVVINGRSAHFCDSHQK